MQRSTRPLTTFDTIADEDHDGHGNSCPHQCKGPAEGPPVVLKDPNDDPVVYTAVAGGADVICTVDRHFYQPNVLAFCSRHGIQLMTDIELLHALRQVYE